MTNALRGAAMLLAVVAVSLAACGCGRHKSTGPAAQVPPNGNPPNGPPQGGFQPGGPPEGGFPAGGGPPGGGGESKIKQIMMRINDRGPNGLTGLLRQELNASQPAWETIQPQTAEYAKLAADLAKLDPPRGSKDSWANLTADFSASATALDQAAQAKDAGAAKAAQEKLGQSCMACHQQHRGGRGGFGGPGGPGRGGPGRGGPGGPPPPGMILPSVFQDMLNVTPEQKAQLDDLQKEVDTALDKLLTDEQRKQLQQLREGGPGGFGPPRGFGPPGGPEPPGQAP